MAITISGTNGIVGAGFTVDNSGVSVTAGVGTFSSVQGSGANLTSLPAANLTGTLPALSAASLTSIPAANIVGVCTSGFTKTGGFGGITDLDAWAVSANYTASSGSTIISDNWYQYADRTSWPGVGSEMTESSGVFTFPKTGLWHIWFSVGCYNNDNNGGSYFGGQVYYSSDSGGSYSAVTSSYDAIAGNSDHGTNTLWTYLDITNATTARIKFHTNISATKAVFGDSSQWRTGAVFTRFGDT